MRMGARAAGSVQQLRRPALSGALAVAMICGVAGGAVVTGTVYGPDSLPLAGVLVLEAASPAADTTGSDGVFSLQSGCGLSVLPLRGHGADARVSAAGPLFDLRGRRLARLNREQTRAEASPDALHAGGAVWVPDPGREDTRSWGPGPGPGMRRRYPGVCHAGLCHPAHRRRGHGHAGVHGCRRTLRRECARGLRTGRRQRWERVVRDHRRAYSTTTRPRSQISCLRLTAVLPTSCTAAAAAAAPHPWPRLPRWASSWSTTCLAASMPGPEQAIQWSSESLGRRRACPGCPYLPTSRLLAVHGVLRRALVAHIVFSSVRLSSAATIPAAGDRPETTTTGAGPRTCGLSGFVSAPHPCSL